MESLRLKLETFEGPLDLLLHLIEKNKVDILDIPIAEILQQYMHCIDDYKTRTIEDLSSFLYMASQLMYIKSKLLLPKSEEEEEDPRKPLVDMLLEYKKYKEAAAEFGDRFKAGRGNYTRSQPELLEFSKDIYQKQHRSAVLHSAYQRVIAKNKGVLPPSFTAFSDIVTTKVVPVGTKAIYVLRQLLTRGTVLFSSLFVRMSSRSEIVATFLAVLELNKMKKVLISDDDADYSIALNQSDALPPKDGGAVHTV